MTVHLIPYPVAATLAEAIGVACLQLQDTDGKRLPARPGQLNDLLLAAVKAIEGVVMCERPDSAVAMMPPPRPPADSALDPPASEPIPPLRFCVDCRFYQPEPRSILSDAGLCLNQRVTKQPGVSLVTGAALDYVAPHCATQRMMMVPDFIAEMVSNCGKQGRWWEPRDPEASP